MFEERDLGWELALVRVEVEQGDEGGNDVHFGGGLGEVCGVGAELVDVLVDCEFGQELLDQS